MCASSCIMEVGDKTTEPHLPTSSINQHVQTATPVNFISSTSRTIHPATMATRSTAARLRRTFHYPTDSAASGDSDSDSAPSAMDEQGIYLPTHPPSCH